MASGSIKTVTDRGFGFIRPDGGGEDLFFHRSALDGVDFDQVRSGDRVTYTAEADVRQRGMRAASVRRADGT